MMLLPLLPALQKLLLLLLSSGYFGGQAHTVGLAQQLLAGLSSAHQPGTAA